MKSIGFLEGSPVIRVTTVAAALLVCITASSYAQPAEAETPNRPIHQAVSLGDIEQIKLHIANGTDLNEPDANQNTVLGIAIRSMRGEVVKVLVEGGADVTKPSRGVPPLIMATIRNNAEIAELLLDHGADVEGANATGMTALIVAAENGYLDIVELLVANGANVNATDKRGQTALSVARARRQTDVAGFLSEHGAEEPEDMFGDDPYGSRGMRGSATSTSPAELGMGGRDRAGATNVEILGDPNEIRAQVETFPDLAEAIAAVDDASASEQRNWRQRRMDNRTMLIRSVEKQFEGEMAFVKKVGEVEKAAKTVAAIDELVAKRKARYELIYEELREERRAAMLAERQATARARSTGRTRGRAGATDAMGGGAMEPYADAGARPPTRARAGEDEDVDELAVDAETASHMRAWLTGDPLDKRELLNTMHGEDLREYDTLRQTAVAEEAKKTAAAIGGLMLSRQDRVNEIMTRMAEEDERLERLEERMGTAPATMRGRAGRGAAGQEDTTTQRAGRRSR